MKHPESSRVLRKVSFQFRLQESCFLMSSELSDILKSLLEINEKVLPINASCQKGLLSPAQQWQQTLFQSSCLPPSSQKDLATCKSHSCQLPKPPFPYHIGKATHWIGG